MSFDIYISHYVDKNSTNQLYQQWVDRFEKYMHLFFGKLTNTKFSIVTSYQLVQNEDIRLNEVIKKSKAFIILLSPEFANSVQYQNEIQLILKNRSIKESNFENIFKVFKSPVSASHIPSYISDTFDYNLYSINPETEEIKEYEDFVGTDEEAFFWFNIMDLCYDLYEKLIESTKKENIEEKEYIYLAEASQDQDYNRKLIKRDFMMRGYKIIPNKHLPTNNIEDLEKEVMQLLEKSIFSIHLFGDEHGRVVQNTELSIVDLQNQIASKFCENINATKAEKFFRYLWIPPDLKLYNDNQAIKLEKMKRNVRDIENAEMIETPLEVFRSILRNRSFEAEYKLNTTQHHTIDNKYSNKRIYIIYESKDRNNKQLKEITSFLNKKGYTLLEPEFGDDQRIIINTHKQNLINSEGLLIFYNNSGLQWLFSKQQDIIKAPGFGKHKPFLAKGIITHNQESLSESHNNKGFLTFHINLNNNIEETLAPFFNQLKD